MATFPEVQAFLRERFTLERDTETEAELTFVTQVQPGKNEAQHVVLRHERWSGESWLSALADICSVESLAPLDALHAASKMRVSALTVDTMPRDAATEAAASPPAQYVARRVFAVRNLDMQDLARELQYVALEASVIRAHARPPTVQPATPEAPKPGAQWAE